ncbi:MAG: LuxR C-terminal-related transcriptional regulator [Acidimicrobiales bacterium]
MALADRTATGRRRTGGPRTDGGRPVRPARADAPERQPRAARLSASQRRPHPNSAPPCAITDALVTTSTARSSHLWPNTAAPRTRPCETCSTSVSPGPQRSSGGTELNKIVWYWQPPPAEPAGDAEAPAADPSGHRCADARSRSPARPPRTASDRSWARARRLAGQDDQPQPVLSESTVRSHLSAAFKKLGVRSQAELVERYRLDPPPET